MPRRAVNYESKTAENLRDPSYASYYLHANIQNHDMSFKSALADMIDRFGHAEFAVLVEMQPANVTRLVKDLKEDKSSIKLETIERVCSAFGLKFQMDAHLLSNSAV